MTRARAEAKFASEAALCAKFLSAVKDDWTAYPETCGWDVLLVRGSDGFQIGIEAKLRLNAEVLNQALEDGWVHGVTAPGPDCRAVMVPYGATGGLGKIAACLGVTVIRVFADAHWRSFEPDLPGERDPYGRQEWFECCPTKRHPLPEYVPDVAAGVPAPTQLTAWKIAAIKIAVTVEKRGFVTRADFKHHKIDHRRWTTSPFAWVRPENGVYVAGPRLGDFKAQHPRVYDEIAADSEKWMPPAALLLAATGALFA